MKPIAGGAAVGVIVALVIVYLLRPLNAGAVGLIVVVCVAICAAAARAIGGKKS